MSEIPSQKDNTQISIKPGDYWHDALKKITEKTPDNVKGEPELLNQLRLLRVLTRYLGLKVQQQKTQTKYSIWQWMNAPLVMLARILAGKISLLSGVQEYEQLANQLQPMSENSWFQGTWKGVIMLVIYLICALIASYYAIGFSVGFFAVAWALARS